MSPPPLAREIAPPVTERGHVHQAIGKLEEGVVYPGINFASVGGGATRSSAGLVLWSEMSSRSTMACDGGALNLARKPRRPTHRRQKVVRSGVSLQGILERSTASANALAFQYFAVTS
jgi:hypothetical protein